MPTILFFLFVVTQTVHAGPCECPNNKAKNGSRCGERSAFCKPGGDEPSCGATDEKSKIELFKQWCPKAYKKLKTLQWVMRFFLNEPPLTLNRCTSEGLRRNQETPSWDQAWAALQTLNEWSILSCKPALISLLSILHGQKHLNLSI